MSSCSITSWQLLVSLSSLMFVTLYQFELSWLNLNVVLLSHYLSRGSLESREIFVECLGLDQDDDDFQHPVVLTRWMKRKICWPSWNVCRKEKRGRFTRFVGIFSFYYFYSISIYFFILFCVLFSKSSNQRKNIWDGCLRLNWKLFNHMIWF